MADASQVVIDLTSPSSPLECLHFFNGLLRVTAAASALAMLRFIDEHVRRPVITGQSTPIDCPPGAKLAAVLNFSQMRTETMLTPTIADHTLERLNAQDAEEM